jgi:hypothetical protein
MALTPDPKGYIGIKLGAGNDRFRRVNRLVLEAFVGTPLPGQVCRHLDGDKTNNRVENLCWGSTRENNLDIVRHGRHRNATKAGCIRGHAFTEENTFVTSLGTRQCRECHRARSRASYAASRQEELLLREAGLSEPTRREPMTRCPRGHEFTPANTVKQPRGRLCRTCANARQRARRRGISIDELLAIEEARYGTAARCTEVTG